MQLFVCTQELHTLEVTGQEMVAQIKVLTTLEVAGYMLGMRGQTPRVAKQEKKKTGQTKRRMQYNQHFVNVVPTFGKKKGPI
uniref:Uncharacterized protein n=1 Tax=Cebus imitator TaxID=2715852 RepID=A0A2K5SFT1_CEBIM